MKPSEKLWTRLGQVVCVLLIIFSIGRVNNLIRLSEKVDVPVTITSKYATGYHTKYSIGEKFHVNCYNEEYGTIDLNVSHNTFFNLNKGDKTTFTLSRKTLGMKSSMVKDETTIYQALYDTLALLVLFLLLIYLITISGKVLDKFNKFIDKTFKK